MSAAFWVRQAEREAAAAAAKVAEAHAAFARRLEALNAAPCAECGSTSDVLYGSCRGCFEHWADGAEAERQKTGRDRRLEGSALCA